MRITKGVRIMNEITVSAKTLDDAITEALIQLGITSDQLDYDVIEKGSAGFLGFGCKQAVIRARRKVQEVKEEPVSEEKEVKVEKSEKREKPVVKKEFRKENKRDTKKDNKRENRKENKKETVPVKEVVEKKEQKLGVVQENTITECEKFLKDVLGTMGMDVQITSTIDEEGALNINMEGDNMGILIGKRGQTLDSLQYLTNRIANKSQEDYVRVKLDTENYRQRRKETLENLAKNIAYKVKRTKKAVSLEPMNPYERRVIHSALQGDKYVSTHSEGEEPYRRVVITLARK